VDGPNAEGGTGEQGCVGEGENTHTHTQQKLDQQRPQEQTTSHRRTGTDEWLCHMERQTQGGVGESWDIRAPVGHEASRGESSVGVGGKVPATHRQKNRAGNHMRQRTGGLVCGITKQGRGASTCVDDHKATRGRCEGVRETGGRRYVLVQHEATHGVHTPQGGSLRPNNTQHTAHSTQHAGTGGSPKRPNTGKRKAPKHGETQGHTGMREPSHDTQRHCVKRSPHLRHSPHHAIAWAQPQSKPSATTWKTRESKETNYVRTTRTLPSNKDSLPP
jgi:hypothetical protein